MRGFWGFFLIIVCLFNVLHMDNAEVRSQQIDEIQISSPQLDVTAQHEMPCDNQQDQSGHNCHLGHCNFLVISSPLISLAEEVSDAELLLEASPPSPLPSLLYRPPSA